MDCMRMDCYKHDIDLNINRCLAFEKNILFAPREKTINIFHIILKSYSENVSYIKVYKNDMEALFTHK